MSEACTIKDKRLWLNGEWLVVDWSGLAQFVHDLPHPDDTEVTSWLRLFSFNPTTGGSGWGYVLERTFGEIKLCTLTNAASIIEYSVLHDVICKRQALSQFESTLRQIELLLAQAKIHPVLCWAEEDPSEIQALYNELLAGALEVTCRLPHMIRENYESDTERRSLAKACIQAEIAFNRWKKQLKKEYFR